MNRGRLGSEGLEVSAEGLGCMGMTWAYGSGDEKSGEATIHRALELGITFLDTAEVYGPYTNEELVGRAIAGRRDQFEIATKFGFVINPDAPYTPHCAHNPSPTCTPPRVDISQELFALPDNPFGVPPAWYYRVIVSGTVTAQ